MDHSKAEIAVVAAVVVRLGLSAVHAHSRRSLHQWDNAAAAAAVVVAVCTGSSTMIPSLVVNMAELVLLDQQ